MSRQKYRRHEETELSPLKEELVTLRLRENHFVRGVFAPGGSLHQFTPAEAERELRITQLWDPA